MKTVDLTQVYRKYKGLWVALKSSSKAEVIASGKTLKETLEKAHKKGVSKPLVTQIPQQTLPIVGIV